MTDPLPYVLMSDLLPKQGRPVRYRSWRNYSLALLLVGINFQCVEFTNEFMRICTKEEIMSVQMCSVNC